MHLSIYIFDRTNQYLPGFSKNMDAAPAAPRVNLKKNVIKFATQRAE
jgi:hypothetical protein